MKESVEFEISSDVFTETLNSLIENESVIVNTFRNRECISLPKENFQEIETEKVDITEQFHQFKNDFLDEFNGFKTKFLHEVKSFKDSIFNTTPKNTGNQEHIVTLLLDNITFLKDQLRQEDNVIDSLINQLSEENDYLFQKRNTDNQLETNLGSVIKSKETEKIIITANNNKTEDTGERKSEKGSETSISNNKSSQKDFSHEVEPTNTSNSQENKENNDTERGKGVTSQNQEISPEKNFSPSFTEKHISHDTRASNSKISGNKKCVIILGDSMTKLLNGCEMAKKTQSNCKIYVKTFSGATVSCMEDYMKPSLRNLPDHFILHVGTNDLCSEDCSMEIAESIINLACRLKNEIHDVSVSTIILRTDDKKLNEKRMEVNLHLKELSKEKNISLTDCSRKIKSQHLNKGKLHLTKYSSKILSNNFVNEISKVLH